jgi:glycosyltransferase A (GT-A) superfamily protein (DUF2064 family)
MVTDIVVNISACGLPIYLFHDGMDDVGLPLEWLSAAVDAVVQHGDSLGERMTAAFGYLFFLGLERVILTGSDIPGIDAPLLQSAIDAIQVADAVFSPAIDGGYCLVASNRERFNAVLFQNIPWSTSQVLAATLTVCRDHCLTHALLEPRQDIDTLRDIEAYCQQPSFAASITNNWLASHGYLLP